MCYCINPDCQQPNNPDNFHNCQACGNDLLIQNRYRLVRHLRPRHQSTYFEVYEADDRGTPKVLKVLKTNHNHKYAELFEQEAKILTCLEHPGIPKAERDGNFFWQLDNGQELHCLVMEKIEGQNLQQWLQENQRISQEHLALNWLRQLVEILDFVHYKNFFHRDIKPSNIMRKPDGQLVLIDFGTAREVTETVVEGRDVTVVYSHGYTAQEQIDGRAVPQSDFFALGRTFVHLLTGKHPNSRDFSQNSRTKQLIWRSLAPQISEPLANLIDKLMAPLVKNRPRNTQIILQSLNEIEQNTKTLPPDPPPPPAPPWPSSLSKWSVIFGVPIILLLGVWIGWIISQPPVPPTSQPCTSPALDVSEMAFSRNGKYLAQASLDKTVRVFDAKQLLNPPSNINQVDCKSYEDGLVALKFSPDGTQIATASLDGTAQLWTINPNSGIIKTEKKSLSHMGSDRLKGKNYKPALVALDFSYNGKHLATASSDGIVKVWSTDKGEPVALLNNNTYVRAISFSQDGKYLATVGLNNKALVWEWQADPKGEKAKPLQQKDVVVVAFSPTDTRYLATASADGIVQVWDMTTFQVVHKVNLETYPMAISFSSDGKYLVTIGLDDKKADLWEWEKHDKPIRLEHNVEDKVVAVAFSPKDGKYLATASDHHTVRVWTTKGQFNDCEGINRLVAIAFNPSDANLLAMASADGSIKISRCQAP